MKFTTRDCSSKEDYAHYDTKRLRSEYLVEQPFGKDEIHLVYSYIDRIVFGGVIPAREQVALNSAPELRAEHFLDRREMGVINVGQGAGKIKVDGIAYPLNHWEALYIGRGAKEVIFSSDDEKSPAMFYLASAPAHRAYPTKLIDWEHAIHRHLGAKETCNERSINQFILPATVQTCQLEMGLTHLEPGSVWNTMPCHTHERRMEVYMYFDMEEEQAVFHFMGPKEETRHILVHNYQAVISPSWSIHTGCSNKNYTFVWAMCGENQDFDDMDEIKISELR